MREGVRLVAPDGGWGWMVVLGFSLNNLFSIPILQNFGLVFRDVFTSKGVNFSNKEINVIINTNAAFGYILGILNGPILRTLGFRRVAMVGGLMMFVGLVVTSQAHDFYVFFIFYSLLNSLGIGWTMASFHLALSTYFVKKRGMAMGLAMTVTGLGPVIMPLVIAYLMSVVGDRGTLLLLAGLVLHSVFGGLLLQPVKWHRKAVPVEEVNGTDANEEGKAMLDKKLDADARGEQLNSNSVETSNAVNGGKKDIEMKDFTSSKDQKENFMEITVDRENENGVGITSQRNEGCCGRIVRMFDLDLMKDPAFFSMLVGMGIALASDVSFSLLLPLILGDYEFDTDSTAKLQAVVGAADIFTRFLTPFITRKTTLSARVAYLMSLVGLILSRFCLTLTSDYYWVAGVVFFFGMSKGVRAVFMPLVIPNYVPIEKLPSALGLQNVMNGFFLMLLGPLIGYLRDKTGNYMLCIHIMNSLTTLTILLWTLEFVYMRSKKKNTFADVADDTR